MFIIREATVHDVETIRQLANETWGPTYGAFLAKEQINYMLDEIYSPEKLIDQITKDIQFFLLLIENDKPVAFTAYGPRDEDPDIYKLHKLYCLPSTQGKGYGKVLINTVIEKVLAAGKTVLELNVNRYNNAKTFYERMGFTIAYEEDLAIGPYWMNDFVMRKEL